MDGWATTTSVSLVSAACAALVRARHRDELVPLLADVLRQHTAAAAVQVTWLANTSATPLLPAVLPPPTRDEHALLAAEQIVQRDDLFFVPMIAGGVLRGWTTLQAAHDLDAAQVLSSCAGVMLAMWAQQAPPYTRTPVDMADLRRSEHLAVLAAAGDRFRAAGGVEQVCDNIVSAMQALTHSTRILVYLCDWQREWVTLCRHVGFSADELEQSVPRQVSIADAEAVQATFESLGQHLYRNPLPPPGSPLEQVGVLELTDQQHTAVGAVIFDLADRHGTPDAAFAQTLDVVANQAASALIAAQLLDEQQRTVDQLTALSAFSLAATSAALSPQELMRIAVGGAVGTTGGMCGGALLGHEAHAIRYCQCAAAESCAASIQTLLSEGNLATDYVERGGDAVPAAARAAGVGSFVCAPLRGTTMTLGHLWVAYRTAGVPAADREMVLLYAKTAGAALENLHLFGQLRTAHDRFAAIMASSTEGMVMVDASGDILVANAALERLLGVPGDTITHADVLLETIARHNGDGSRLARALGDVASGTRTSDHGEVVFTTPEPRALRWSVVPVQAHDAPRRAALLVVHDVTAEHHAARLQQDLTHMVIHDLRAPLANMIASLDLLRKETVGPLTPRQAKITDIAWEASHHMVGLVNGLLDMRRLEREQLALQRTAQDLFAVVHDVVRQFEHVAHARTMTLHTAAHALPPVLIDGDVVRRVLHNLIDNALKFSITGEQILVTGTLADAAQLPPEHAGGRWALVEVIDHGPGVPEAYHTHVFELFGQAPNGRNQGNGIGLAFCKLAVEAHGGMIWITDTPSGGATLSFTLPLA